MCSRSSYLLEKQRWISSWDGRTRSGAGFSRADAALSEAAFVHSEDLSAENEKRLLRKGAMDVQDHRNVAPDVVAGLVLHIWPPKPVPLSEEINELF